VLQRVRAVGEGIFVDVIPDLRREAQQWRVTVIALCTEPALADNGQDIFGSSSHCASFSFSHGTVAYSWSDLLGKYVEDGSY
jgi:hypothetical protein